MGSKRRRSVAVDGLVLTVEEARCLRIVSDVAPPTPSVNAPFGDKALLPFIAAQSRFASAGLAHNKQIAFAHGDEAYSGDQGKDTTYTISGGMGGW